MNKADPDGILGRLEPGSAVAVIRLRSLGDSVLATPAVHLLKRYRPDLRIAVVSEPRFAPVWQHNPDISDVLEPKTSALRRFGPRLCLNLHGGTTSMRLTVLSGAKHRAGYAHFRYPAAYNIRIPAAQRILHVNRKVHTAEHAASAMFYLGVPEDEIPRARLFAPPAAFANPAVHGPYAVIHPVASQAEKTWPAPLFNNIAQYLKRELGLEPVFIAGPGEDISAFQMWPVVSGTSLNEIKSLLAGASLFLGNDSGPAHMAAAFALPVVVLFGPSDPVVWSPWKTESVALTAGGAIHSISEAQVMRALDRMRVHA